MTRFEFDVAGMSCRNCERVLTDRLTSLRGVDAVNADHAVGEVVVIADERDCESLEQVIAGAGYTVRE